MTEPAGYDGFRGEGGRLAEAQLDHLQTHRTSLLGDSLPYIHEFDKAHLVALAEADLLTSDEASALLSAMREMEREGIAEARERAGGGMHSAEHYLIGRLGIALGGRINLGRSSGDLIEVARRLTVRSQLDVLLGRLAGLRAALLALAEAHAETVMPGYTHGQHAQPTTLGHWAAMFERALARDTARVEEAYARVNLSPAGAAIMTGSDFPLDRARTAELLGFDAPLANTMDAILSHDLEMELAAVYAVDGATLGRMADDLFLWTTVEFDFIELPDRFCGTSSIMPQKKNPDALEAVKSAAGQSLGVLVSIVSAERGPTGFPILERRSTQDALWATAKDLATKAGDLTGIIADMSVHSDRMERAAGSHWAQVTDLSSALVRTTGIDWRRAHQIVGRFVRDCIDAGVTPGAATVAHLDAVTAEVLGGPSGLSEAEFAEVMSARAFVERRVMFGAPAPSAVLREVTSARIELKALVARNGARERRAVEAHVLLEQEVDRLTA
ncbi:argininosuccinate lyase [Agromyces mangrovi Wang et al. 2018]|uniref:argininosuccinate lyase n=1 Tax=Agromyces mangrovi TaxID=1858653 RepID=UPI00257482C1|nr:argininosuccinate lyase [Agromyces mangrovi]BDZ65478.1 argininosuccinate lyase [Agromyces mangrovi]